MIRWARKALAAALWVLIAVPVFCLTWLCAGIFIALFWIADRSEPLERMMRE